MDRCLSAQEAERFLRVAIAVLDIGRAPKAPLTRTCFVQSRPSAPKLQATKPMALARGTFESLVLRAACISNTAAWPRQVGSLYNWGMFDVAIAGPAAVCQAASLQSASSSALEFGDAV